MHELRAHARARILAHEDAYVPSESQAAAASRKHVRASTRARLPKRVHASGFARTHERIARVLPQQRVAVQPCTCARAHLRL
eukprot:632872-Pleurochrysis_carterae.AAC.1